MGERQKLCNIVSQYAISLDIFSIILDIIDIVHSNTHKVRLWIIDECGRAHLRTVDTFAPVLVHDCVENDFICR